MIRPSFYDLCAANDKSILQVPPSSLSEIKNSRGDRTWTSGGSDLRRLRAVPV